MSRNTRRASVLHLLLLGAALMVPASVWSQDIADAYRDDANRLIDAALASPFINALVVSTQQDQVLAQGQPRRQGLVEAFAVGAQVDAVASRQPQIIPASRHRFWLEQHATATAEGRVVYRAMPIRSILSQVVYCHLEVTVGDGSTENTGVQGLGKKPGEKGDDIDSHVPSAPLNSSSTPFTVIRRACVSMLTTKFCTAGINTWPPPSRRTV